MLVVNVQSVLLEMNRVTEWFGQLVWVPETSELFLYDLGDLVGHFFGHLLFSDLSDVCVTWLSRLFGLDQM